VAPPLTSSIGASDEPAHVDGELHLVDQLGALGLLVSHHQGQGVADAFPGLAARMLRS